MFLIKAILFVLSIVLGWNAIQVAVEVAANHELSTAMILFAVAILRFRFGLYQVPPPLCPSMIRI